MNWIEALSVLQNVSKLEEQGYVLVTVLETRGSIPRATGAKMVVTQSNTFDTIGGGALEYRVIEIAKDLLTSGNRQQYTQNFNLGKDLKQCCGGVVNVFFEVFNSPNFNIVIFGAGHIGKALVKILSEIECSVRWFDSRSQQFPKHLSANINVSILDSPEIAVESCLDNSYFLVMTHDHDQDMQICEAILSRKKFVYCGLIGSKTKSLKFKQRLQQKGFSQKDLEKLHCPMGLSSVKVKQPMQIAVSIIAHILKIQNNG